MKIYIATKNEKKITLAKKIISKIYSDKVEVFSCITRSNVPETPWEEQTYQGAKNRAHNSLKENSDADLSIGIETGLIERYGQLYEETWCCITDKRGKDFLGYTSGNVISDDIEKRVIENKKKGSKILEVFDANTKSWISYSGDTRIRENCLSSAIKQALIQLITEQKVEDLESCSTK